MREIKFRAWDTKRNKMLESINFQEGMPVELGYQYYNQPTNGRELVIMQFTGLRDKNGKEIYEGDIVKWPYYKHFKIGKVAWGTCGFWIVGYLDVLNKYRAEKEIEVIGNIYEGTHDSQPKD